MKRSKMGLVAGLALAMWAVAPALVAGPQTDLLTRRDVARLTWQQAQALLGQDAVLPRLKDYPWSVASLPKDGSVRRQGGCLTLRVTQGRPVTLCDHDDRGAEDREPDSRTYGYLGQVKGRYLLEVAYMHDHAFLVLVDGHKGKIALVDPDDRP